MGRLGFHNETCFYTSRDSLTSPIIVLVHGVGLTQEMWSQWVRILETSCSVITFDLYGHGQSESPDGRRDFRSFVDQINKLLKHLGVRKFALVGFSLGALISQAYASLHPDRLTHLILLHSAYRRDKEQCQSVRERYEIAREKGPMATVEMALKRWFTEEYRKFHPQQVDKLREVFSKHGEGYLKAYYLFSHAELEMCHYPLHQVSCPALVITGSNDTGSTPAMSERLVADLSNAELVVNAGHRHMAPLEHCEELCSRVLSLLDKHVDRRDLTR